MRRGALLAVALCICTGATTLGQSFDEYSFEPFASAPGVSLASGQGYGISFLITEDSRFVTWDKADNQVEVYTLERGAEVIAHEYRYELERDTPYRISGGNDSLLIDNLNAAVTYFNLRSGQYVEIAPWDHGLETSPRGSYVLIDTIIAYSGRQSPGTHTFQITQTEQGLEYIYRDPEQTREYIDSTHRGRGEFWFDGEYLMYGERLVTANGRTFGRYFGLGRARDVELELTGGSPDFVGIDNDGNYYWNRGNFMMIFDSSGDALLYMRYAPPENKGRPQIDPQGNIYILSYGGITPGQLDLLWIERDW